MELLKKYLSQLNWLTSSLNSKIIATILLGLITTGFGVIYFKNGNINTSSKIEIIQPTTAPQTTDEITVEISGAVEKPGVYKMKNGDRVDDLLIIAGGLATDTDRIWVEKNINRAAKINDGQKLYIYHSGELSAKSNGDIKVDQEVLGVTNGGLVNINTASASELDKLSGIGPVYAQSIIEHRPYSNLEDLVKNGAIKQSVFDKIKNEISVY